MSNFALASNSKKGALRPVQLLPWTNSQVPAPWPTGYARVMIPFTALEARNAKPGKTHHFQVVRISRLVKVD